MFEYPCPDCYSTLSIHNEGCEHSSVERESVEKAYIDIISMLSVASVSKPSLENAIDDWSTLHADCLSALLATDRVAKYDDGRFKLLTSEEREKILAPTTDPLKTIYEYGTVPGCHDNGIFALIAYFANQDLSWEQTKTKIEEWFERTGTWERGGFDSHSSVDDVIEDKKHVWEEAYGWSSKGKAAARIIENHQKGSIGVSPSRRSPSTDTPGTSTSNSRSPA